jgi:hypothetical protein
MRYIGPKRLPFPGRQQALWHNGRIHWYGYEHPFLLLGPVIQSLARVLSPVYQGRLAAGADSAARTLQRRLTSTQVMPVRHAKGNVVLQHPAWLGPTHGTRLK